ncbi:LamG-like jellyroll fold domain-containing protein [Streptomyces sp. NPDC087270]|uniref:LamG domain-containing protein n=1 Tax=Streptomyces sp. NPDC087270 TaxID=3365774 RepID=UPI0037F830E0
MGHAVRRFAVVGVLGALAWSGVSPLPAAADDPSTPTSEAEQALADAQASGQQVEVVGQRTETTTTYANPDGLTFTLDQAVQPVRVRTANGSWTAPDPTLYLTSGGSVAPKAAAVDLTFSDGGSTQPLVSIGRDGRSMALTWPGALPTPVLDGDSAVYAEVFPGVDLRLTASAEGYHEVLVVKTPAAAADPRVKQVQFGMHADGLHVRATSAGGLSATGADGQEVFTSPAAQVWNSLSDDGSGQQTAGASPSETAAVRKADGPQSDSGKAVATSADSADATDGPAPGAGLGTAKQSVAGAALTVTPDADVLGTTDQNAFPIYVDPDVSLSSGAPQRTLLRSDGYTDYGWGNGSDKTGEGDGHCGTWDGYYCGPGYTQRLYFQFTPSALKGKKVLGATFRVTSPWAFQCDPRWTDLERTNNFSSSTSWSSKPKELDLMVDRSFSAGRGSSCDPDSPAAPIEFADNSAETNENLTPTVASFAAGKFSKLTLELRAHDESDTSAWKRFKNDAVLSVNYVGVPALPTKIGIITSTGTVCSTNNSDPAIISDPTPALTATAQTASGGEAGARLRVAFSVDKYTNSTWSSAFSDLVRPTSGFVGDNANLGSVPAPTLSDGTLYRYRAWTRSYYDNQSDYIPGPSNASTTGWCYFKIDSTAPKAPTVTFTGTYTECLPGACTPQGGPGVSGTVKFAAASGDTDTGYEYQLSSDSAWKTLGSGVTTATIQPQISGTLRIDVRAKDSLGRWGADTVKDFLVAAGAGPVGQWHFDEDSDQALDSASSVVAQQHNATLSSTGAVRDGFGRRGDLPAADGSAATTPDKGLHLNGATGYAATSGPVLETRSAYTVSAWVRLEANNHNGIVLSQDGSQYSPFVLSYDLGHGTWLFGVKQQDADTGTAYYGLVANQPARIGVWTHLLGTYDPGVPGASDPVSKLYVNGVLQGTAHPTGTWAATGPLQIGRYKWAGTYEYNFPGSIDEVRVWQRTLTDDEAATEARQLDADGKGQVELVGSWQPSGSAGTSVVDTTSGYGRSLGLTGGASLTDDGLVLDGTSGAAAVPGPVVDDTGSFTVTSTVALDSQALASEPDGYIAQVVGERTAGGSAWGLWFELKAHDGSIPLGVWHFGRLNADGTFTGVTSDDVAELDSPVQLTGVFDAQSGVVRLYSGVIQNGTDTPFTPADGTGDLAVGEGPSGTGWGHYLPGVVSDVRIWAGAMSDGDQIAVTVGD